MTLPGTSEQTEKTVDRQIGTTLRAAHADPVRRSRPRVLPWREIGAEIVEIPDVYRIGGDDDSMPHVVTEEMKSYDRVYRTLIRSPELETVTSYFSMEAIAEDRPLAPG